MHHIIHIQINALLFIIVFSLIPLSGKTVGNDEIIKTSSDSLYLQQTKDSTAAENIGFEIPSVLNDTIINFNLTSDIYYTKFFQFTTNEGKRFFVEGWKKADALKRFFIETDSLRCEYAKSSFSEDKTKISNRVIELEDQIITTKSFFDFNNMKAREIELNYWNNASELEKIQLIAENDSIKTSEEKKLYFELKEEIVTDSIQTDSLRTDSLKIENKIPVIDQTKSGNIIFKVQIGAYNTELPESAKKLYKKISMLRTINQHVDERNYTIYTIGELTNIKDAIKLQEQIRQESVKDAFVIAYKDGKRIPLNVALESTK